MWELLHTSSSQRLLPSPAAVKIVRQTANINYFNSQEDEMKELRQFENQYSSGRQFHHLLPLNT